MLRKASGKLMQGCLVKVTDEPSRHQIGGSCEYEGAMCASCGCPLQQFLLIDVTDPALKMKHIGVNRIPFLHCPCCRAFLGDFVYRLESDSAIRVLVTRTGTEPGLADAWNKEHAGGKIARRNARLVSVPKDVQQLLGQATENDAESLTKEEVARVAAQTGHYAKAEVGGYPYLAEANQVGGVAYLPQGRHEMDCPTCGEGGKPVAMEFLACICDDPHQGIKVLFPGAYLEYRFCPKCRTVCAMQFAT